MVVLTRQVSVSHSPPAACRRWQRGAHCRNWRRGSPCLKWRHGGNRRRGRGWRTQPTPCRHNLRPSKKLAKAVLHEREVLGLIADVFPHLG